MRYKVDDMDVLCEHCHDVNPHDIDAPVEFYEDYNGGYFYTSVMCPSCHQMIEIEEEVPEDYVSGDDSPIKESERM